MFLLSRTAGVQRRHGRLFRMRLIRGFKGRASEPVIRRVRVVYVHWSVVRVFLFVYRPTADKHHRGSFPRPPLVPPRRAKIGR